MRSVNEINAELATERGTRERLRGEMIETDERYRTTEMPKGVLQRFEDTARAILRHDNIISALESERDACLAERAERLNAMRGGNVVTVTGDGAAGAGAARASFNVNHGVENYDRSGLHVGDEGDGQTYRSRALAAIDSWRSPAEWKESAERLVTNADTDEHARAVADHLLKVSSPDYTRAFRAFLRNPASVSTLPEAQRAALAEGTGATGGYAVPAMLDPAIILTNVGIASPFRQLARVVTITTQVWKGISSAGVTAEWAAEAAEAADASPTFAQPTVTPIRGDAFVQASFEALADTDIGTELPMLFADARDRLEGTAFAVGTGSTQPLGIVTELGTVTASRLAANTNGSIGLVDIYALDNNLPPRYRPGASFVMAKGIANTVRQIAIPSLTSFSPWVDLGGALPSKLIGYPVFEASGMVNALSAATASNDDCIVLGDFKNGMVIADRLGATVSFVPLIMGANRRPTGESGFFYSWRTGAGYTAPQAFQMLRA